MGGTTTSRNGRLLGRLLWAALLLALSAAGAARAQTNPLAIGAVQGSGESSPWVGRTATVTGVVTGYWATTNSRGATNFTLFIQEQPDEADGDPATSDGLAVYVGREAPPWQPGDRLRVTGPVVEFYGLTEIGAPGQRIARLAEGEPLPPPVPLAEPAGREAQEGMRVTVVGPAVVTTAAACGVTVQLADGATLPVLGRDDRACSDPPMPPVGTVLEMLTGVLIWQFEAYRLVLQTAEDWSAAPPPAEPTPQPPAVRSDLLITELFYQTFGRDDEEEWIEIANVGATTLSLDGYSLGDEETPGEREGMVRFPAGTTIEPGRALIVAQTAVGFQLAFGFKPNFELRESDPAVPNLVADPAYRGAIALANDGDELLLRDPDGVVIDMVAYGDSAMWPLTVPTVGLGESLERIPAPCDADGPADWQPQRRPSPGSIVLEGPCAVRGAADPSQPHLIAAIGDLQGSGVVSPYVNQFVRFQGVVIGIQEDTNTAGVTYHTLFVQDPPGAEDGRPETSDAVAVFTGRQRLDVQTGDLIAVQGRVIEYYGLTEISDWQLEVAVLARDQVLPSPIALAPPGGDGQEAYFERLEAMRVFPGYAPARVVGSTYSACGFTVVRGEETAARFLRRSAEEPANPLIAVLNWSDTQCADFPDVKTADEVSGLIGPLVYSFDQFRIVVQPDADLIVDAAPLSPLPQLPPPTAGQFSLLSYNAENYFDEHDDTGDAAEPKPTPAELARKQRKLAWQIGRIAGCPTIVALQEVENAALLVALAAELAPICGFTYSVVHRESADARGIDLAYLTDPTRVAVASAELAQQCSALKTGIADPAANCPTGEDPLFSRPPFVLTAAVDGRPLTVINNHLKSKREGAAATARLRLAQARHLAGLASALLAADPDARVLVVGDFNDYEQSDATRALQEAGLVNLLLRVPAEQRYSYIYGGEAQLIDGVWASPRSAQEAQTAELLHINADFPAAWAVDETAERLPYRATDHNPPWALFALDELPVVDAPVPAPDAAAQTAGRPGLIMGAAVGGGLALAGGLGFWLGRRRSRQ